MLQHDERTVGPAGEGAADTDVGVGREHLDHPERKVVVAGQGPAGADAGVGEALEAERAAFAGALDP